MTSPTDPQGELNLSISSLMEAYPPHPLTKGVRGNMVATIDGAIAINGRSTALSSETDKAIFRFLRATCSAIVVGAKTAQVEKYGPVTIGAEFAELRKTLGLAPKPRLVVVGNARHDLQWIHGLSDLSNPTILVISDAPPSLFVDKGLTDTSAISTHSEPTTIIADLCQHSPSPVLCEGGPGLLTTLANASLLAELCLTQTLLVAGSSSPSLFGDLSRPLQLSEAHLFRDPTHRFSRYRVDGGEH